MGIQARLTSAGGGWLALARAVAVAALWFFVFGCSGGGVASPAEPWGSNVVSGAELAKELATADKPVVVCTAPPSMFRMGHIPGAVLHGPTSDPRAYDELTAWGRSLPRTSSVVIYCGCCPLAYCPNLRPAYNALKDLGFARLRVLVLPENFGTDWVDRGYPVER